MLLTDLNPRFVNAGGEGITSSATGEPVPLQKGVGMSFDCPCGCDIPCYVDFANPVDGSKQRTKSPKWSRDGKDFATMSLYPSIRRVKIEGFPGCEWHGEVRNGEITAV